MTDWTRPALPTSRSASPSVFLGTFAIVIAAIFLLIIFDSALAKIDRDETRSHARGEYATGLQLVAAGSDSVAISHFRIATELDRDRTAYTVALAGAMLHVGRAADAEQLLTPILERNATDGASNLMMARVLASEGRIEEAKSYYHRAIYGLWPADTAANRSVARFELIDLLARTGAKQELLAELLPIQDVPQEDTTMRKRMAHLFIVAGSPGRAISIFRGVLEMNPRDADSYLGLGEATLELGNFPAARGFLRQAVQMSPHDDSAARQLALADTLLALDPTQRALSLREQYRRSRILLQRTLASTASCVQPSVSEVKPVLDSATTLLAEKPNVNPREHDVEENLSLSAHLWAFPTGSCAARLSRDEQMLSLLQKRIQD